MTSNIWEIFFKTASAFALLGIHCLANATLDESKARASLERAVNDMANERYASAYTETEWMLGQEGDYQVQVFYIMNQKMLQWRFSNLIDNMETTLCDMTIDEYGAKLEADRQKLAFALEYDDVKKSWTELINKFESIKKSGNPLSCTEWKEKLKIEEEHKIAEGKRQYAAWVKAEISSIKASSDTNLCIKIGEVIRNEKDGIYGQSYPDEIGKAIKSEISRRKLSLRMNAIKSQGFKIGDSKCHIFAAWGKPDDVNRSVGPWGTHEQFVYRGEGTYIYLENGRITSFQD